MGRPSLRTCVGCRRRRERRELVRLHADADGRLTISRPGAAGRGAHLCPCPDCLQKALAGKRFPRALRRPVIIADPAALAPAFCGEIQRRFPAKTGREGDQAAAG
ncbi:MAG: YlxR family protein [candidate division NC10 bacterium]|nr:YlxR family protein [candidate division NC10 bacterium]